MLAQQLWDRAIDGGALRRDVSQIISARERRAAAYRRSAASAL